MHTDLDHINEVGHMYTDYTDHTKHKPYRSQRSYVCSAILHHTDRDDHTCTGSTLHIDHTIQNTYTDYTRQIIWIIPYKAYRVLRVI